MAPRPIYTRVSRPRVASEYLTESAYPLGLGLDLERERTRVERAFERERRHVELLIPHPEPPYISYRPGLWRLRQALIVAAVSLIVLAGVGLSLLRQPSVPSRWSGEQQIISRSYAVTPTPAGGPAALTFDAHGNAIVAEALPQGITADAAPVEPSR